MQFGDEYDRLNKTFVYGFVGGAIVATDGALHRLPMTAHQSGSGERGLTVGPYTKLADLPQDPATNQTSTSDRDGPDPVILDTSASGRARHHGH
eukprot:8403998-Pyramimonas_sp.AAC.1